ncbi:ABC transporter ATP-binding protein [Methanobacterium sp.]|uniref:ABC transporter ATP-binding protein n=1 Tax=Methanobacterium sp. TaxID=2164 RepID=UPI003C7792F1
MNNNILEFQEVWKTYGTDKNKLTALKGINLKLKKNSLNLILGPSGSGKTTLLNLASMLDTPTNGKIIINGQDTSKLSKLEKSKIRRNQIGIVYQRANLFPYLNILENTMLPMISNDINNASKILNMVGLVETSKFPDEISIEKQQKGALARAMINDPSLIVADEPTGELDKKSTEAIMDLIIEIKKKYTVLIVSNNVNLKKYCDNLFLLEDGYLQKIND